MFNQAILIGRLCADPEVKQISENITVGNFRLAVDGGMMKGEKVTEFLNIVTFNKTAENCGKYLHKGSLVQATGRIQTRKYQKEGVDHYMTEIVANQVTFLDSKPKTENRHVGGQDSAASTSEPDVSDIPF